MWDIKKLKMMWKPFQDKMRRLIQEYVKYSKESKNLDNKIHKNLREIGFEI